MKKNNENNKKRSPEPISPKEFIELSSLSRIKWEPLEQYKLCLELLRIYWWELYTKKWDFESFIIKIDWKFYWPEWLVDGRKSKHFTRATRNNYEYISNIEKDIMYWIPVWSINSSFKKFWKTKPIKWLYWVQLKVPLSDNLEWERFELMPIFWLTTTGWIMPLPDKNWRYIYLLCMDKKEGMHLFYKESRKWKK